MCQKREGENNFLIRLACGLYVCLKCFSCWLLSQRCNLLNCSHKPIFLELHFSTKTNWVWTHFVFYFLRFSYFIFRLSPWICINFRSNPSKSKREHKTLLREGISRIVWLVHWDSFSLFGRKKRSIMVIISFHSISFYGERQKQTKEKRKICGNFFSSLLIDPESETILLVPFSINRLRLNEL